MSPATATDRPYLHAAGQEPLPGYTLVEPLGRGGFGEVWLCMVPGGLPKAVKFVAPDPDLSAGTSGHALQQEYEAFQTIKLIRHPFLLTLERVELVDGELVMVMELADAHLQDRFQEVRRTGQPGIPRNELLGYLADSAEALDVIGTKHGLAHLDVKPANLFMVSGRGKVGDYGLVTRLTGTSAGSLTANRGLTPRYVAPEVLRGGIDARSDQYSLALVYHEMLTGTFPYTARSAQQMMMQHVSAAPDLSGLPAEDRPAIARALSKTPGERFPSCLALVQALMGGGAFQATINPSDTMIDAVRRTRLGQSTAEILLPSVDTLPPAGPPRPQTPAYGATQPAKPLPRLTTVQTKPPGFEFPPTAKPAADDEPIDLVFSPAPVRLPEIRSVLPVGVLLGRQADPPAVWADQVIDAVLWAAAGGPPPRQCGEPARGPDGGWHLRFPTTVSPAAAAARLQPLLADDWFDDISEPMPGTFVLRRYAATGGMWNKFSGKKAGMELSVRWPPVPHAAEVTARVGVFGTPDAGFARAADESGPGVLAEVRRALGNVEDRRKAPRIACSLPVTVYPLDDSGSVHDAMAGTVRDVSSGGVCLSLPGAVPSRYVFAAFDLPAPAAGLAILVRLTRVLATADGHVLAGRFRTDL